MDPTIIAAGIKAIAPALQSAAAPPPVPNQRSDGYAMGGMLDGRTAHELISGATGGAYGGAWAQNTLDGSNWTVSTGKSKATGGGTSGGNGGMTPTQTTWQGGIAPIAGAAVPSGPSSVFEAGVGLANAAAGNVTGNTTLILLGFGVLALLILRR